VLNPEKTIIQIKRKMGTDYKCESTARLHAQEISALILRKIKTDAEAHLGEKIAQVVITVPAYFNDNSAGHEGRGRSRPRVLRLVNEPTAAALAYAGQERRGERSAVLDLGEARST